MFALFINRNVNRKKTKRNCNIDIMGRYYRIIQGDSPSMLIPYFLQLFNYTKPNFEH